MQSGSTDKFYKSREWMAARFRALHKAGHRCEHCGVSVKKKGSMRVDHIKPRKSYPELSLDQSNLQVLCASCDNKKHKEKGYKVKDVPPVMLNGAPEGWLD